MASKEPTSDTHSELWNELVVTVLSPLLHCTPLTVPDHIPLSTRMVENLDDIELYPFIHSHVIELLDKHCEECFLPTFTILSIAFQAFDSCCAKVRHFLLIGKRLSEVLSPLEDAYLQHGNREPLNPRLQKLAKSSFRKNIFYKIADILRQTAFKCISDHFSILMPSVLSSLIEFIKAISDSEEAFAEKEWNIHLRDNLIRRMIRYDLSHGMHLKQFMVCAEHLSTLMEFVFISSSVEHWRTIKKYLAEIRDYRIFESDVETFEKMIVEEGDEETIGRIFNIFQDDRDFLESVSRLASRIFSELVHGRGPIVDNIWLNDQNVLRRLTRQWKRILRFIIETNANARAIRQALRTPLLNVIDRTWPKPEDIVSVLAKHCESILSVLFSSRKGDPSLSISDEISSALTISIYLPSAHAFPDFFKHRLSKTLLYGSPPPLKMEQLTPKTAFQEHVIHNICAMFHDAAKWPLYNIELFPTIEAFRQTFGQIGFEVRVVRRSLWNLEPDVVLILPGKLRALSESIQKRLELSYPMRCIPIHSLAGQVTITTSLWTFHGKAVKIELTTAQCCVLMRFEENEELSLQAVAKLVLPDSENRSGFNAVIYIVKSMMAEQPLLLKRPLNSEFHENDIIYLNKQFKPETGLIIPPVPERSHMPSKSLKAEAKAVVRIYNKLVLKASLMKILKQERETEFDQLKEMVYSRMGSRYDMSIVNFEELVEQLRSDGFLTAEKTIVRYVE